MTIGDRIKIARNDAGMTQEELGRLRSEDAPRQ